MTKSKHQVKSPYLNRLVAFVEGKRKGIKHSFKDWSYKGIEDNQGVEFIFERLSEKPSRLTIWAWEDGSLCLDLRTYAKHDGWEFEHRVDGTLSEDRFEDFVALIKDISQYFSANGTQALNKRVALLLPQKHAAVKRS